MDMPVDYVSGFIADTDKMFDVLWSELEWERRPDAPRREYWTNTLNRSYTYGRGAGMRTYSPKPTHQVIEDISHAVTAKTGIVFEACFLNGYETERDGLGWHADDDPAIDHTKPIAVVTIGGGRAIQFMPIGGGEKKEIFLEPGSLLLMKPGMQSTHLHRIPKASFKAKPRISLTFRGLW